MVLAGFIGKHPLRAKKFGLFDNLLPILHQSSRKVRYNILGEMVLSKETEFFAPYALSIVRLLLEELSSGDLPGREAYSHSYYLLFFLSMIPEDQYEYIWDNLIKILDQPNISFEPFVNCLSYLICAVPKSSIECYKKELINLSSRLLMGGAKQDNITEEVLQSQMLAAVLDYISKKSGNVTKLYRYYPPIMKGQIKAVLSLGLQDSYGNPIHPSCSFWKLPRELTQYILNLAINSSENINAFKPRDQHDLSLSQTQYFVFLFYVHQAFPDVKLLELPRKKRTHEEMEENS